MIEKFIRKGTPGQLDSICVELFAPKTLQDVATDRFSNFVVQRALEYTKGQKQANLIQKVLDISNQLRNYKYGKFVLNCVEKVKKSN